MINHFLQQIPLWISSFLTWEFGLQAIIALLLPLVGAWVKRIITRRLDSLRQQVETWPIIQHSPWMLAAFPLIHSIIHPFTSWVLGRIAIGILQQNSLPIQFLQLVVPFFAFWTIYALLNQIIQLRFSEEQAQIWKRQIIRPIFWIVAVLHGMGLLDDILNYEINLNKGALTTLQSVVLGIIIIAIFILASRHVRSLLGDVILPQAGIDPSINQIISTFSSYAVVVAGFWLGLTVAGIDVTTLTFIVGGISIGIGFGLQELINNFISGFILLLERSLVPGDVIKVNDTLGVVDEIKLRTMKIRTPDDVELIVPNGHLFNGIVVNYHQARTRQKKRIHIKVNASYNDDPHHVIDLLLQAAEHPLVGKTPPPQVLITNFGDNGIDYELLVWINDAMKIPFVQSELRLRIWDLFKQEGVEIPYPQRDIRLIPVDNT